MTGLEIAWLVDQLEPSHRDALARADLPGLDGCPFQQDKLCGVHTIRPLGCRTYYCDPAAQDWQNPAYETYLDDLRTLHDKHGLDYRYIEWRWGLADATRRAIALRTCFFRKTRRDIAMVEPE